MTDFLSRNKELINTLESVAFILAVVILALAVLVYAAIRFYKHYGRLREDILSQIAAFNRGCFIPDRLFFEKVKDKNELKSADFIRLSKNAYFLNHMRNKEPEYYRQLMEIVRRLRMLRAYAVSMIVFVGVFFAAAVIMAPMLQQLH